MWVTGTWWQGPSPLSSLTVPSPLQARGLLFPAGREPAVASVSEVVSSFPALSETAPVAFPLRSVTGHWFLDKNLDFIVMEGTCPSHLLTGVRLLHGQSPLGGQLPDDSPGLPFMHYISVTN